MTRLAKPLQMRSLNKEMPTMSIMKKLWNDESAANAVEYGLIVAVIAVALIAALLVFRTQITGMFQRSGDKIQANT